MSREGEVRRGDPAKAAWPVAVQAAARRVARIEAAICRARGQRQTAADLRAQLRAALAELEAAKVAVLAGEGLADGSARAGRRGRRAE